MPHAARSRGALAKAVLGQQGLIPEAGYEEQAQSYQTMASAARATSGGSSIGVRGMS
jgi:hypothetical protein